MAQAPAYRARGKQRLVMWPVAASQALYKGCYLAVDAAERAILACASGALPGTAVGAASGKLNRILGRYEGEDIASTTVDTLIPVMVAEPGTQFEIPIVHNTAASAVASRDHLGQNCELTHVDATRDWFGARIDVSTNAKLKIVGVVNDEIPGWPLTAVTTNQYSTMWAEFLEAESFLNGGW